MIKKLLPTTVKKRIRKILADQLKVQSEPYSYKLDFSCKERLKNKTIMITGANGGIGSAISLRLAAEGAIVGVSGRNMEKISSVCTEIRSIYPEANLVPIQLDVLNEADIETQLQSFAKEYGHIDIFINNAGGGGRGDAKPLREQSVDIIDRILNTNLRGAMLCARVASKLMVEQKSGGKIISMSSVMGMNGHANWSEYAASKAGIIGMTKSLALELGEYNIKVNCISPGYVYQTPFDRFLINRPTNGTALKRRGYTDEVASLVAFLCSDEADYITGHNFVIDGGRTLGLK